MTDLFLEQAENTQEGPCTAAPFFLVEGIRAPPGFQRVEGRPWPRERRRLGRQFGIRRLTNRSGDTSGDSSRQQGRRCRQQLAAGPDSLFRMLRVHIDLRFDSNDYLQSVRMLQYGITEFARPRRRRSVGW